MSSGRGRTPLTVVVLALLLLVTGCQVRDRAGGAAGVPVTHLTLAGTSVWPTQVQLWVDEVRERSKGSIDITPQRDARHGEVDYELGTVADVRDGTVDLAWVGLRVFDRLGVPDFEPMLAPRLVDSLDLQEQVFEAGIPAGLLSSLDDVGVVGVGALPGPMRMLLGLTRPFVTVDDFAGARVGMQDGKLATDSLRALGAVPVPVAAGAQLTGLDAYEQQLASIQGNHYADQATALTGNLALWPRPLAIIANPASFERLSDDQRRIMVEAIADLVPRATEAERAQAGDALTAVCAAGLPVVSMSESALSELEERFRTVNEQLEQDPRTAATLAAIERIKTAHPAAADSVSCPDREPSPTPTPDASRFDGTYRMTVDWAKVPHQGCDIAELGGYAPGAWVHELVIKTGTVQIWTWQPGHEDMAAIGFDGLVTAFHDQMQIGDGYGAFTVDARLRHDRLNLSNLRGGECDDQLVWTSMPWVRQR